MDTQIIDQLQGFFGEEFKLAQLSQLGDETVIF